MMSISTIGRRSTEWIIPVLLLLLLAIILWNSGTERTFEYIVQQQHQDVIEYHKAITEHIENDDKGQFTAQDEGRLKAIYEIMMQQTDAHDYTDTE